MLDPRRLSVSLVCCSLALAFAGGASAAPEDTYRTFLSRDRIGAADFVRAHPEWDGRGDVVLAVLDTGVDMTLPGLRTTSTGETKVVDARDFSGQGDVTLARAVAEERDGRTILRTDDGWVDRPDALPEPALDGVYWLGFLDEARFRNSAVSDINGSGGEDERFALLVVRSGTWEEPRWSVYPDRDADRDLAEEAPVHDYIDDRATFTLAGADPAERVTPLAFAPTVDDRGLRPSLSLHFVDGSHGSHVAGIAAGSRILGEIGFDGIAPGARILSLKIGDNTLAGGSTTPESIKKALEYAAEWSRERGDFVVVNISYGIGSEIEGRHDIDQFVDELVRDNPRVAIATSAGNAGPGLSTVGTPSGATLALAAAALLTPPNAKDLYGVRLSRERLFSFSARGGELDKPDVVAPGVAWSTVPDWETHAVFRGTSMASPQTAGAMLLLASGAAAQAPPLATTAGMIYRALRHTGQPMEDTLRIAQGGGVIDVPAAWDALRRFGARGDERAPLAFHIETDVPTQPGGTAPAALWRAGGYVPVSPLGQRFQVHALLPGTQSAEARQDFFETYELRSDARWLSVDRRSVGLRAELPTAITVTYDESRLTEPGVYTGRVRATPSGASTKRVDTAFSLTSTVIVPHRFGGDRGYTLRREREALELGHLRRWFVLVPPGATTLDVRLKAHRDRFAFVQLYLFDPAGRAQPLEGRYADSEKGTEVRATVAAEKLAAAGIYEIVVYADYRRYGAEGRRSTFDLDLRFSGATVAPVAMDVSPGAVPEGSVGLRNLFDERFVGRGEASVVGVERTSTHDIEEHRFVYPFDLGGAHRGVEFVLELAPEDYARYTDVALTIFDPSGKAVALGGFMGGRATISLASGAGTHRLELRAGAARAGDDTVPLELTERFLYRKPIAVDVRLGGAEEFVLYPGVDVDLSLRLASVPPQAPDGFQQSGRLRLVDARTKERWLERRFRFGGPEGEDPLP